MPTPKAAAPRPRMRLKSMDCRSTPRASCWRSAPRYWAIWIENAVYSPTRMPWSSQVLELTMPMAAVASAPMWPTMAASMYSIAVTTSCSRMEGMLSASAMRAVSDSGMSSPCRIRAESCSKESVMSSPVFCVDKRSYYYRHGEKNCQTGRLIFWLWRDTLSE